MTDKLAVVIATKPAPHPEHVSAEQERELLEHFNCTLMNNGNSTFDVFDAEDDGFWEAKHIIPIFGYPESWGNAFDTYCNYPEMDNVYYYNCGGTIDGETWNGLDEPGTRGVPSTSAVDSTEFRIANLEQARAEIRCVKAFLPGLKTVVSHPFPCGGIEAQLKPEVGAWRLSLMEQYMDQYADRLAQIPELWAYLINSDFIAQALITNPVHPNTMRDWASTIGPRVRAVGATCLLINDVSLLKYLFDYDKGKLTAVGKALLEGMRDA